MLVKELCLFLREFVLCGGALVGWQEERMNGMMMSRKVLRHDFCHAVVNIVNRVHSNPRWGVGGDFLAIITTEGAPSLCSFHPFAQNTQGWGTIYWNSVSRNQKVQKAGPPSITVSALSR